MNIDGERCWIPIQYEKLPKVCFSCGCIIHDPKTCKNLGVPMKEEQQFGPWLQASVDSRRGSIYTFGFRPSMRSSDDNEGGSSSGRKLTVSNRGTVSRDTEKTPSQDVSEVGGRLELHDTPKEDFAIPLAHAQVGAASQSMVIASGRSEESQSHNPNSDPEASMDINPPPPLTFSAGPRPLIADGLTGVTTTSPMLKRTKSKRASTKTPSPRRRLFDSPLSRSAVQALRLAQSPKKPLKRWKQRARALGPSTSLRGNGIGVKRHRHRECMEDSSPLSYVKLAKKLKMCQEIPMVSVSTGPHADNLNNADAVEAVGQPHRTP